MSCVETLRYVCNEFPTLAEVRQLYPRFIECCPWVVVGGGAVINNREKGGTKVWAHVPKQSFKMVKLTGLHM